MDYRADSPFIIVKKGDVLARDKPALQGRPGYDVTGQQIPCSLKQVPSIVAGTNVRVDPPDYLAAIDGRLEWDDRQFQVNPVLEIQDDVDYRTGHIDFPGDVVLHGVVRDRFHVRAGRSVLCTKTLDASDVTCGGDLFARSGIIGRHQAAIRVKGSVRTKYVENCHVEAVGDLVVETGIVNSRVHTLGKLTLGRKGVIVGGHAYALEGVAAAQLGTATGPRTQIHCGVDYEVTHRLNLVQEKSVEISLQLHRVENRRRRNEIGDTEANDLVSRLEDAQARLLDAASRLVMKIDRNDEATVEITGIVHPGTYIEICNVGLEVNRLVRNVRFTLDKERGVLALGPRR